jgi:hypothetical protein
MVQEYGRYFGGSKISKPVAITTNKVVFVDEAYLSTLRKTTPCGHYGMIDVSLLTFSLAAMGRR